MQNLVKKKKLFMHNLVKVRSRTDVGTFAEAAVNFPLILSGDETWRRAGINLRNSLPSLERKDCLAFFSKYFLMKQAAYSCHLCKIYRSSCQGSLYSRYLS